MDNLLKHLLAERNNKPQPHYFYHVAVELWHNRNATNWIPDVLNQRIDFNFIPAVDNDKVINELQARLDRELSDTETVRYWLQFIQCFVKLKPFGSTDSEHVGFSVGYHVSADVTEVYPPYKRMQLITEFKVRWNDKEV